MGLSSLLLKEIEDNFRGQPVTAVLLAILACIVVYQLWTYLDTGRRLPPGPIGLPIVGYLPFLRDDAHKVYFKLSKKYGPIFSLRLGQYNAVVLNSFESLKESGRMDEFTARPPGIFSLSDHYSNMGDMSGKHWKEQRKFLAGTLRNVGMSGLKVEDSIKEQISITLETLKSKPSNTDVNLRDILSPAVNNIALSLICSKTYDHKDEKLKAVTEFNYNILKYFTIKRTPFYFPAIYKIYMKLNSQLKTMKSELMGFEKNIRDEIKEHENSDESESQDYMDFYLNEIKKRPNDENFNVGSLLGNSQLMIMASSETIRSTTEWIMLCLARHQLTQKQVYKEIIEVLGPDKQPEWKDRGKLVLVQALILEVMRYKTLVGVSDPHYTTADVELLGHKIPKDTIILLNLWAVHFDESFWGDPEQFRIERWLTEDFKSVVNTDRNVAFGVGKRNCTGDRMAELEVFLLATSIIQKFRILPPKDGVCLDEMACLTQMVVKPVVRVEPR